VLSPVLIALAILIRLESPGPVLFRQLRMGADDVPFRILKFRTMVTDAEAHKDELRHLNKHDDPRLFKVPEDPRVTPLGRVLRGFSLDELPQLINVLQGEMSLVGPRPLPLDEDRHVHAWARHRLAVKPGITGLWQVLGREEIPFGEMVKLDYLYVTEWSLLGDVKLLLRTVPAVLRRRDAC
jgi:lipopolysaccharide/colanic/teichoic acid biosynthesis glycosyltransferase